MQGFVKLPNSIFGLKLSPTALKVFAYLSSRSIGKNGVCVKYAVIAEQLHLSVSSVRRAVSELDSNRLIHKQHRFGSNGYKANLYYVKSAPKISYFTIDNSIISSNMSAYTFMVYCYIISLMDNRAKQAFPSLSKIAEVTGISKGTVISSVKYLRDFSYLNRIHRNYRKNRPTKAFRQNKYKFFTYSSKMNIRKKARCNKRVFLFVKMLFQKAVISFSRLRWCIFQQTLTRPTKDRLTEKRNI